MKEEPFEPVSVMKIYKQRYSTATYIEVHDIAKDRKEPKKYIEGLGKPITKEALARLLALTTLGKEEERNLFRNPVLSENLISFFPTEPFRYICWYNKAQKRRIEIVGTKERIFNVFMPATLYYVKNKVLHIFALKSNTRPTLNTELFGMPLPNLNSATTFCWGDVKVNKHTKTILIDDEMKQWERLVWRSQFDTYNIGERRKLYKDLDASGKRFPKKDLVKMNMKLKDLLR